MSRLDIICRYLVNPSRTNNESIIKPFFEQFPLLLHKDHFLCMTFQRVFHFIGAWARNIELEGYWIFLISKPVSIVLNKHVVYLGLFFLDLFLYLNRILGWNYICDNLLQVLIVESALLLSFFGSGFLLLLGWLNLVGAWSWNGVNCFLQLTVYSLSSFILENTGRLCILVHRTHCLTIVFSLVWEIKIISQVIVINGVIGLPFFLGFIEGEIVSLIEGISSIVFGLFEDRGLVIFILLVVMQHVFLFLRNQEAILQVILFGMKRHLTLCFRLVGLKILLFLFSKVVEGFNKFLS